MTRPRAVSVLEVGPRDGLQNDPVLLPTEAKVAFIRRLASCGLTRIEAVSFVNAKRVPQMADAEAVLAALDDLAGVSLSGLVLNERGFDRALASGRLREITFVLVASETFSQRNQGASIAGMLDAWRSVARRAEAAGLFRSVTIAAAFGCPFEGEVPLGRVLDLARKVVEIGAEEVALADTIGVAVPCDVEERFTALAEVVGGKPLRAHLHNTRNTGYANADAAIRSGVSVLDASLGGIGGCPFAPEATGNVATEDLAYLLERSGVETGLSADRLRETTLWLEGALGRRVPAQTAHVRPFPPLAAAA
jgi:hydroxymethylglutaryl-CoA lyase